MSNALLQLWICTTPVLASLLFAPMLVCAQPGVWLPAPVAAIIRAVAPSQTATPRSAKADAAVTLRPSPLCFLIPDLDAIRFATSFCFVTLLSDALSQSAPRAP